MPKCDRHSHCIVSELGSEGRQGTILKVSFSRILLDTQSPLTLFVIAYRLSMNKLQYPHRTRNKPSLLAVWEKESMESPDSGFYLSLPGPFQWTAHSLSHLHSSDNNSSPFHSQCWGQCGCRVGNSCSFRSDLWSGRKTACRRRSESHPACVVCTSSRLHLQARAWMGSLPDRVHNSISGDIEKWVLYLTTLKRETPRVFLGIPTYKKLYL